MSNHITTVRNLVKPEGISISFPGKCPNEMPKVRKSPQKFSLKIDTSFRTETEKKSGEAVTPDPEKRKTEEYTKDTSEKGDSESRTTKPRKTISLKDGFRFQ